MQRADAITCDQIALIMPCKLYITATLHIAWNRTDAILKQRRVRYEKRNFTTKVAIASCKPSLRQVSKTHLDLKRQLPLLKFYFSNFVVGHSEHVVVTLYSVAL